MSRTITARGWCRVDFAGGTLDIWPLGLLHPGSVTVNVAVDLPVTAVLRERETDWIIRNEGRTVQVSRVAALVANPETALPGLILEALSVPPVEVELSSASPRGGGLGGSSALAVTLIAAALRLRDGRQPLATELVHLARDLEARLMGLPTGIQDHYPAILGGALAIEARPGTERVTPLEVDLEGLSRSLVVAYTGSSHFSAGANWTIVRRRFEADPEIVSLLDGISETARELRSRLEEGNLEAVGALMGREWSYRRQLSPAIPTAEIEALLAAAHRRGAWGGKACGAGGGGSVAVLAPPERVPEIVAEMTRLGAHILPARPIADGLRVEVA